MKTTNSMASAVLAAREEAESSDGYHTADEDDDGDEASGSEAVVSKESSREPLNYDSDVEIEVENPQPHTSNLDVLFQVRFIEIKIISGDVVEASEFVLMISDIGFGVKRRIVTAPEISSLTERVVASIEGISLEKVTATRTGVDSLRLIDCSGSHEIPWIRFQRYMAQASDLKRYTHLKLHVAQIGILLDHEFVGTICGWNRQRRKRAGQLPKKTASPVASGPPTQKKTTLDVAGVTILSPVDALVPTAPAVGVTLAISINQGVAAGPQPTVVARFGGVWTKLDTILLSGISSVWKAHPGVEALFAISQNSECLEIRIADTGAARTITLSSIDVEFTPDMLVQMAWMAGTWKDTIRASSPPREVKTNNGSIRVMKKGKGGQNKSMTIILERIKVWIDVRASGREFDWIPDNHACGRGPLETTSPWVHQDDAPSGLCALEISDLCVRKSSQHETDSTTTITFESIHLDAFEGKAKDCESMPLLGISSTFDDRNVVEIKSIVQASHTARSRASISNHFIEGSPVELGAMSLSVSAKLGSLRALLDTYSLARGMHLLGCVSSSIRLGKTPLQHARSQSMATAVAPAKASKHAFTLSSAIAMPSKKIDVTIAQVDLDCYADGEPLLDVAAGQITTKIIEYADRQLNIITGDLGSLVVIDKPTGIAIIDGAEHHRFISWDIRNRHLKIDVEEIQIIYMNRVLKEILAFIKFYLRPALAKATARPEHLLHGSRAHWLAIQRRVPWCPRSESAPSYKPKSNQKHAKPMEVTVVLVNSEIELPKDSSAEDALVIKFPRFTLTKGAQNTEDGCFVEPNDEMQARIKHMSRILHDNSDRVAKIHTSIREYSRKNAACVIQRLFRQKRQDPDPTNALATGALSSIITAALNKESDYLAKLIKQRREHAEDLCDLLKRCDPTERPSDLPMPFQLNFAFEKAVLSNMTEENNMCPNLDLQCTLTGGVNAPNHGASMYASVFRSLKFEAPNDTKVNQVPIKLDIVTPQIDLHATTDQWALIFEMIGGNFAELPVATKNPLRKNLIAAAHMVVPRRWRHAGCNLFALMPRQIETAVHFVKARIAILDDPPNEKPPRGKETFDESRSSLDTEPADHDAVFEDVVENSCAEIRASDLFLGIDNMKAYSGMCLTLSATQIAAFDIRRHVDSLGREINDTGGGETTLRRHPALKPEERSLCDSSARMVHEAERERKVPKQVIYTVQNSPYFKCHDIDVHNTSLIVNPDTLRRVVGFFAHPFTGNKPREMEHFDIPSLVRALELQNKNMKVSLKKVVVYGMEDLQYLRGLSAIPEDAKMLMLGIDLDLLHSAHGEIIPAKRPRQIGPGSVCLKLRLDINHALFSKAGTCGVEDGRRQQEGLVNPLKINFGSATEHVPLLLDASSTPATPAAEGGEETLAADDEETPRGAGVQFAIEDAGNGDAHLESDDQVLRRAFRAKWIEIRIEGAHRRNEVALLCSPSELKMIGNIAKSAKGTPRSDSSTESASSPPNTGPEFDEALHDEEVTAVYLSVDPIKAAVKNNRSSNALLKLVIGIQKEGGNIPLSIVGSNGSTRVRGAMQGVVKLHLEASYFNQKLCIQEPLLEPFDLLAQWSRKSANEALTASLDTDSINVNVTSALLECISKGALRADATDSFAEPCVLRNETGDAINLTFQIDALFVYLPLSTDQECGVDLEHPVGWGHIDHGSIESPGRGRRERINNSEAICDISHQVSRDGNLKQMQLSWGEFVGEESVNLNNIGEYYVHLTPLDGSSDTKVFIVTIEMNERGQRCITIGTQVHITNSMNIDMEIRVNPVGEGAKIDAWTRTLRPNEAFYVPASYIDVETALLGRMLWMPPSESYDRKNEPWVDLRCNMKATISTGKKKKRSSQTHLVVAEMQPPGTINAQPWSIAVETKTKSLKCKRYLSSTTLSSGSSGSLMRTVSSLVTPGSVRRSVSTSLTSSVALRFLPAMRLHNALCVSMEYRVKDDTNNLDVAHGIVSVGCSLTINIARPENQHSLLVRIANYAWSKPRAVYTSKSYPPKNEGTHQMELKRFTSVHKALDGGQRVPSVNLTVALVGIDVTIFCRSWIINETGLDLQYCPDRSNAAYAQMSTRSMPSLIHRCEEQGEFTNGLERASDASRGRDSASSAEMSLGQQNAAGEEMRELAVQLPANEFIEVHVSVPAESFLHEIIPMVVEKGRRIGHFEELAEFSKDRRRMVEFVKGSYKLCNRDLPPAVLGLETPVSDLRDDAISLINNAKLDLQRQDTYCYYPEEKKEPWFWDRSLVFDPPRSYAGDTELCVRVAENSSRASSVESEWSQGISAQKYHGQKLLSGQGRYLELKTPKSSSSEFNCVYQLGVDVAYGKGRFSRTAVLTFVPHHILVNASNYDLEYTQVGCEETWTNQVVHSGQKQSFLYWPRGDKERIMKVRFADDGASAPWSSEFRIDCPGEFWVKVRRPKSDDIIMRLSVEVDGASLLAHFEEHDKAWPPYRIENNTGYDLRFKQVAHKGSADAQAWDTIGSHLSVPYAWDHPVVGTHVLRVEFEDGGKGHKKNYNIEDMAPERPHGSMQLRKVLPKFADAAFYGELSIFNASTNSWAKYECALKDSNLFILKAALQSSSKGAAKDLWAIINVACSKRSSKADVFQDTKRHTFLRGLRSFLLSGSSANGGRVDAGRRSRESILGMLSNDDVDNDKVMDSVVAHILQHILYPSAGHIKSSVWNGMVDQEVSTMRRSGSEWVDLLIACGLSTDAHEASLLGQAMLERNVLYPVDQSRKAITRMTKANRRSMRMSMRLPDGAVTPGMGKRPSMISPLSADGDSRGMWSPLSSLAPDSTIRSGSVFGGNNKRQFFNSSAKLYSLDVDKDADINPSGKADLVIVSTSGKRHVVRCADMEEAVEFTKALRQEMVESSERHSKFELEPDLAVSSSESTGEEGENTTVVARHPGASRDDEEATLTTVEVRVHSDGATKVLEFTEEAGASKASSDFPPSTKISIGLAAVTLSFVDSLPEEVLFAEVGGINFRADLSPFDRKILLGVNSIQVDNQIPTAQYSTLLRPAFYSKGRGFKAIRLPPDLEYEVQDSPAVHVHLHQTNLLRSDCISLESVAVWLRPLEVTLEILTIAKVINIFQENKAAQGGSAALKFVANADSDEGALKEFEKSIASSLYAKDGGLNHTWEKEQKKLYCKQLQLFAVELKITSSVPLITGGTKVPIILSAIPEINEAKISLSATNQVNTFGPPKQLIDALKKHYIQSFILSLRSVIGSIDVIGSPIGLLSNVSSGVKDFVYQPLQPLSQHHDSTTEMLRGVAEGAAMGTTSLVSKSIGGTFGTAAKLTGAVGSSIALTYSTTFNDRNYAESRGLSRAKKGTSARNEFYEGGKALGYGIYDGVSGVVMEPIRGIRTAQQEHTGLALGLSKGFARGIVGVAVKPAVGMMDFTARAAEAMRKASTLKARSINIDVADPWSRTRPPRVMSHRKLEKFDAARAQAQMWLVQAIYDDLLKDRMKDEHSPFVEHLTLCQQVHDGSSVAAGFEEEMVRTDRTRWLLCTHSRLLLVQEPPASLEIGRKPTILLECPIDSIDEVTLRQDPQQVIISLNAGVVCKYGTERAGLRRPKILDQKVHLESIFFDLLVRTIGESEAMQHATVPAPRFVAIEGKIKKLPGGNVFNQGLRSATRHWCVVAKHVLYIYRQRADASTPKRGSTSSPARSSRVSPDARAASAAEEAPEPVKSPTRASAILSSPKSPTNAAALGCRSLWIVIPLSNLTVEVYKKSYIKLSPARGSTFPSLKRAKGSSLSSGDSFVEVLRSDVIFQPEDTNRLEAWKVEINGEMVRSEGSDSVSQSPSSSGEQDSDASACRYMVLPCETLEDAAAKSMVDGIDQVCVEAEGISEDIAEFKRSSVTTMGRVSVT